MEVCDGRGFHEANASDASSGLAIDAPGRRIFMSHEQLRGQPDGVVTEFSIATASAPTMLATHSVPGVAEDFLPQTQPRPVEAGPLDPVMA